MPEITPTFLVRSQPDAIGGEQFFVFVDLRRHERHEILDVFFEPVVGLILQAADAKGVRRKPRAAVLFENLENLFAIAERVKQRRDRADIERMRSQPKLVAGDAVQFRQDHANVLRPRRRFNAQEAFRPPRSSPEPFETAAT